MLTGMHAYAFTLRPSQCENSGQKKASDQEQNSKHVTHAGQHLTAGTSEMSPYFGSPSPYMLYCNRSVASS